MELLQHNQEQFHINVLQCYFFIGLFRQRQSFHGDTVSGSERRMPPMQLAKRTQVSALKAAFWMHSERCMHEVLKGRAVTRLLAMLFVLHVYRCVLGDILHKLLFCFIPEGFYFFILFLIQQVILSSLSETKTLSKEESDRFTYFF